jgi:hypothetical protein
MVAFISQGSRQRQRINAGLVLADLFEKFHLIKGLSRFVFKDGGHGLILMRSGGYFLSLILPDLAIEVDTHNIRER